MPDLVSFEFPRPVVLPPENKPRSVSPWERSELHFGSLNQMTTTVDLSWVPSEWSKGLGLSTAQHSTVNRGLQVRTLPAEP